MTTETVEQAIQRKGLTAPRVTPEQVEAEIARTDYLVVGEAIHLINSASGIVGGPLPIGLGLLTICLLTICVLTLQNGFTVTGESACASPANFDPEIGRRIARENAKTKVWPLLGFRLRDQLARVTPSQSFDANGSPVA
jgi:hypothetical protein